jgi:hypothetical protein
LSKDFDELQWGGMVYHRKLKVTEVADIKVGTETPALSESKLQPTDSARCFAIVTQKKTMEFMASSVEEKELWVQGLHYIYHRKKGKFLPSLPRQPLSRIKGESQVRRAQRPSLHPSPTSEQQTKIRLFREALKQNPNFCSLQPRSFLAQSLMESDRSCLRYLIARKYDVEQATKMACDSVVWRDEMGLDTIFENPEPTILEIAKTLNEGWAHKCDREGRPILVDQLSTMNVEATLAQFSVEEAIRYTCHMMEFRCRYVLTFHEKDGPLLDETVTVVDLNGLSRNHLNPKVLGFLQAISKVGQDHYPEMCGKIFVVNSGWLFSLIWKSLKPALDVGTQQKITVCNDNGLKEMMTAIHLKDIPQELGGDCRCPNGCSQSEAQALYLAVCEKGTKQLVMECGGEQALRLKARRAFGVI